MLLKRTVSGVFEGGAEGNGGKQDMQLRETRGVKMLKKSENGGSCEEDVFSPL